MPARTSIRRASTSSRYPLYEDRRTVPTSRRTTTAASRSTSGSPFRWSCTALSRSRAARPLTSPSAVSRASRSFVITDLLPHLAADQMKKTMAEGITGEGLNILIGSTPYADEGSGPRKACRHEHAQRHATASPRRTSSPQSWSPSPPLM